MWGAVKALWDIRLAITLLIWLMGRVRPNIPFPSPGITPFSMTLMTSAIMTLPRFPVPSTLSREIPFFSANFLAREEADFFFVWVMVFTALFVVLNFSMSLGKIISFGPDPFTKERSIPSFFALHRAKGTALKTFDPSVAKTPPHLTGTPSSY